MCYINKILNSAYDVTKNKCYYPVDEDTKKLQSGGVKMTVSVRLTSVAFTSALTNKSSFEYKNLKVKVVKAVITRCISSD